MSALHTNECLLIKALESGGSTAVTFKHIRAQPRAVRGLRPLVDFENIGELQEWSLWVYGHLRLPLVAGSNDELTLLLAQRYATDSFVCDARTCARLLPHLIRGGVPLKEVVVIDSDFGPLGKADMRGLRVVLLRTSPERGIIEVSKSKANGTRRTPRRGVRPIPGISLYRPGHPSVKSLILVYTSGTTGAPKLFVKKNEKVPRTRRKVTTFGNLLFLMGADRLAVNFYRQTVLTHDMVAKKFFAISSRTVREHNYAPALAALQPTDIMTTPVLFRHLVENLRRHRALKVLSHVHRITLSQSIPERSTYKLARRVCPRAVLLPRYGASETGFVGMACPALSRRLLTRYLGIAAPLHPLPRVRIHKPDQNGVGEVWVWRHGAWVHTGDAGSLENKPCPCGATRTLIIYGRLANDRISCMGAMFLASEVERVCASLSRYIKDYRVAVGEHGTRKSVGSVQLSIIPAGAAKRNRGTASLVAKKFAQRLQVTKSRTLDGLIRNGIFRLVQVELVDEFPSTVKPLRLRRISDR